MAITRDMSYLDFMNLIKTEFKQWETNLPSTVYNFAYEGFNPATLFNEFLTIVTNSNMTPKEVAKDLASLLGLFHLRGPNTSKMTKENTKGGESAYKEISELIAKYSLKSGKPKSSDITLPRLSMVFASPSNWVYTTLFPKLSNHPVTEAELGIARSQKLFPNYVPCLLSNSALKSSKALSLGFFIHNLYQSMLSEKTQDPKKPKQPVSHFFERSTKYSVLAMNGSMSVTEEKTAYGAALTSYMESIDATDVLKAVQRIFSTKPVIISEEPTPYHSLINKIIRDGGDVSTLNENDFSIVH